MRSQLNKDIQALCLQFTKVYKLLSQRRDRFNKKDTVYLLLLNSDQNAKMRTRFHYTRIKTKTQHERFMVEAEINKLHAKMDAIVQTIADMTGVNKDDIKLALSFHKLYTSAANFFLDAPGKRILRLKTTASHRYDTIEQGILDNLDIIAPTQNTDKTSAPS
jgi:hypothetical protein